MSVSEPTLKQLSFNAATATIQDCLKAIQAGRANVGLAVNDDGTLFGLVTDGDVRRAWLHGRSLNDLARNIVQVDPFTVTQSEPRTEVLDIMNARGISHVPVVSGQGKLIGLHLMREYIGASRLGSRALILAGGRGTRLGTLTSAQPKPLVMVAGRPILERIIVHLVGHGINEIHISVGYLAQMIEDYFGDGSHLGCNLRYLKEDTELPLGTGGPLYALLDESNEQKEPLVVINGDLVTQFNVSALVDYHIQNRNAATVGASTFNYEVPYGVLHESESGRLHAIEEKPVRSETVSAGIYVFNPAEIPKRTPSQRLASIPITDILQKLVDQGGRVGIWDCGSDWIDIGRPSDLARARGQI